MSFSIDVKQNLPTNVVAISHIDGDLSNSENAIIANIEVPNKRLALNSFLERLSYGLVLNEAQDDVEIGVGVSTVSSNDIIVSNIVSDPNLGSSIPLFYKYEIDNLDIVMPVDLDRYLYLVEKANPTTSSSSSSSVTEATPTELEELFIANDLIKDSLIDRIYFTDLYNETSSIKFNVSMTHLNDNYFDVVVYLPNSSKKIGSKYIIYKKSNSLYKQLVQSVPIYHRLSWNIGNVLYRGS